MTVTPWATTVHRIRRIGELHTYSLGEPGLFEIPIVHETALSKTMVFSDVDIQSRMNTVRPDELQFEYTRLMMGVLLFQPQPHRVLMVGLGGGSLAKFCYKQLPDTQITVVEINPHVIALRQSFCIPNDDARFQVVQMDAAEFVAQTEQTFDVMLIDGFDQHGLPEALCSPQFYSDCRRVLSPGGVAVANLHRFHAYRNVYVDRMETAFDQQLCVVNAPGTTNCVVFAMNGDFADQPVLFRKNKPMHLSAEAWAQVSPSMARVFLALQDRGNLHF
jgi:spermidine synthase